MKQFILTTLIIFFCNWGYANHPLVRNFQRDTYKAGTQNWAIVQDESNSMYFANNNGLLKFDGKNWATFPIKNGTNVRSLVHTKDGRFYASTFNDFGYYQKNENGQLEYFSLVTKFGIKKLESNELYNIQAGNNKQLYFQGNKAVYQYDGKAITRYPFYSKIDASAFIHNILFVTSEKSGVFMLNGNLFVRLPGSELLINKKVCSIIALDGDKILLITNFSGVYEYNGNTILPYNTGIDEFLKQNQIFCAARNANQLVFGTVQRGIAVLNLTDRSVTYVNTFSGLQNNTVLCVAFDNKNNLWLGLDKGLDYVILSSPIQNIFGTNNLYGAGYTSLLKNNTLYLGTNQGLYATPFPLPNTPSSIQPRLVKGLEGQIWCLIEIDGTIFCGDDQGAFTINEGRIQRIEGLPGTWNFKPLRLHPGLILGCSYQGLFILKKDGQRWIFSHFIKGKFTESSPMFEEDADGTVWFSHWQKGMFRLHFNQKMDSVSRVELYTKGFPSNQSNTVFRVNNKLIFSSERGFYIFNRNKNRIDPYTAWNQLFKSAPNYLRLHECPNGDVWFVSGRFIGLAKKNANNTFSMDSLTYRILQPKIITGFEHFNFIDNNRLILSTEDGFSWIDNRKGSSNKNTFMVFLNNIIVTNHVSSSTIGFKPSENKSIITKFTHNQNSIRFEFIAPEFRNEGLVQYSYMLENFDENWSEFSSINLKEYTQLPKGHYTFKIKARNVLESKEAICSYSFYILPAWYESQLAIIIYCIFFILLLTGIVIFVNNKSNKGAKEMEKRKEIELNEQKNHFEAERTEKKREIKELKNQQLQYELRHKSQELASSTMNLIRKNEILLEIMDHITKVTDDIKNNNEANSVLQRLGKMERNIKQNIEQDKNWKRFEENFDLVYENFLRRLGECYPELNVCDKRICAYLKMDLSSKDIAPLLNMSIRSVETNRYRLRKKLNLDRDMNLGVFLQKF